MNIGTIITWQLLKSIYIGITQDLTKNSHLWPLQALKRVTSPKNFLGWQPSASHWDLCKGQANHGIALRTKTVWKLVEFVVMLFLWERVVYYFIKFSYGCYPEYNAMIWLPFLFAQVLLVRSIRLPAKEFFSDVTYFSASRGHNGNFLLHPVLILCKSISIIAKKLLYLCLQIRYNF